MAERLKNLRIKTKLFLISGVTIALFSILAGYQMISLKDQAALVETIYEGGFSANGSLKNLRYGTQEVVKTSLGLIAGDIAADEARTILTRYTQGDSLSASLAADWATYQASFHTETEALNAEQLEQQTAYYGTLQEKIGEFIGLVGAVHQELDGGVDSTLIARINTPAIRMMITRNMLNEVFDQLVRFEERKAEADHDQSARLIKAHQGVALVLMILCLVFSVVLTLWMARLIVRPIAQLDVSVKKVVEGDLAQEVHYASNDELGRLSRHFNQMVVRLRSALEEANEQHASATTAAQEAEQAEAKAVAQQQYLQERVDQILREMEQFAEGNLTVYLTAARDDDEIARLYEGFNGAVRNVRELLHQVNQAVQATSQAAHQISRGTEQLAAGAQEQSAQAHEVAAAVEEMAQTIVENAGNAARTAEAAANSGAIAKESGEIVEQTVTKIRQIAEVVSQSAETVERLGASSTEIGEIIAVIDEIADQTNLLALNAAIEAARAGEQGRGFAVVADEVRKLAERTTQATRRITDMIKGIQAETKEAVKAMQQGREEVSIGIRLADSAGTSLRRVVNETESVVGMINQIAAATQEQSMASTQISQSVEAISNVTGEAAGGIAEIAHSSGQMDQVTAELQNLMARFTLEQGQARQPGAAQHAVAGGDGWDRPAMPA